MVIIPWSYLETARFSRVLGKPSWAMTGVTGDNCEKNGSPWACQGIVASRAEHGFRRPRGSNFNLYNLAVLSYQGHLCHPNKKPVLNHPGEGADLLRKGRGVGDFTETTIENVMSFVRDVGIAVSVPTKRDFGAEIRDLLPD